MADEATELHDELKGVVESALSPVREKIDAEEKARGEMTAETKEKFERISEKLDSIEARMEKAALDTKEEDPETAEAKANAKHREDFLTYLRKGEEALEPEVKATLQVRDEASTGILAPPQMVSEIIKGIVEMSPVRELARVYTTGRNSITIPKRTGRPTAGWAGETESFTEGTGSAYGQEEIPNHKLTSYIDVSVEDLQDSAYNLEQLITEDVSETFGETEGTAFVSGSGSKQPEGFQNGGLTEVLTATNDVFAADDLMDVFYAVKDSYARNGTWLMNRGIIKAVRKLKGSDNNYLWQPGVAGSQPPTILDRPYRECPDLASAVADGAEIAAFGDWKRGYAVVDRAQMFAQRDTTSRNLQGEVRFVWYRRVGGQVVLPDALRILKVQ